MVQEPNSQKPSQEDFIKNVIEQIAPVFTDFQEKKMAVHKFQIEKDTEIQQAKFVIINKVDFRDKWYKMIVVSICLVALCLVAYFDKLQGVSPIIGVIIGLVLKSNSMNDFLGASKTIENEG